MQRIAIALSILAAVPAPAAASSGTGTPSEHLLTHDGTVRNYLKYVGANLPSGPRPLVMVLHGGGQSAAQISSPTNAQSHWTQIADDDGLIVVYPDAVDNNWHDCRSDGHNQIGTADDVGFVSAVIDDVDASHDVDLSRVYATGASNGGLMSYRLAFELTHRVAAVGAVAANLPVDPATECRAPDRPVTVAIMNGSGELFWMPWNGGCVTGSCLQHGSVRSAIATRDWWTGANATSTTPATSTYPDPQGTDDDGTTTTRATYSGGDGGSEVVFFTVTSGGHQIPTKHHTDIVPLGGRTSNDLEASEELWDVLSAHSVNTGPAWSFPFPDGFESGGFAAGGWTTTGSPVVNGMPAYTGSYGARLRSTSSMTRAVSTAGATTVRVRYARSTRGLDADEWLWVEWSVDGTTWNTIEQTRDTSWTVRFVTLPSGAAGEPGFRIRFRTDANQLSFESGDVDDVAVDVR